MKLRALNPRWATEGNHIVDAMHVGDRTFSGPVRFGLGITFDCPCCKTQRLGVFFSNPVDGGPPAACSTRFWDRLGETFDTLTIVPSIDTSARGHWHGRIVNGEIV